MTEPKFNIDALAKDLVWENDRAVKQALENYKNGTPSNPDTGAMWDTCFRFILKKHLGENYGM